MVAGMRSKWGMPFCKIVLGFLYKIKQLIVFFKETKPNMFLYRNDLKSKAKAPTK